MKSKVKVFEWLMSMSDNETKYYCYQTAKKKLNKSDKRDNIKK